MRKFAARLTDDGWTVRYTRLDDPDNAGSIPGELLRAAEATGATEVLATEPGEFRLIAALEDCPLPVHQFPDDRFLCSHAEFEAWAEGRKELRMEWFYREMRRKTGFLMEGDKPRGRQVGTTTTTTASPPPGEVSFRRPHAVLRPTRRSKRCWNWSEGRVLPTVFGTLRPFWFATDQGQARACAGAFRHRRAADGSGDYQDAMLDGERFPLPLRDLDVSQRRACWAGAKVCDAAAGGIQGRRRAAQRGGGLHPARSSAGANTCVESTFARDLTMSAATRWAMTGRFPTSTGLPTPKDALRLPRGGADTRRGLCPPHPAAHGDGQFRAAGGHRPA